MKKLTKPVKKASTKKYRLTKVSMVTDVTVANGCCLGK